MEGSKTVDQALDILLALEDGAMTVSDLARVTGINRSGVHRLLASLHSRGFVWRVGDEYRPGAAIIRIAAKIDPLLRSAAADVMRDLTAATGETTVLSVLDNMSVVAVQQCVGRGFPVRVEYEPGTAHSAAAGAAGRAILAHLDTDYIERVLKYVPVPDVVLAQLAQIRENGYVTSADELQDGVHGVGVPVLAAGKVVASLSLIVPRERSGALSAYIDMLKAAGQTIGSRVHDGAASGPAEPGSAR